MVMRVLYPLLVIPCFLVPALADRISLQSQTISQVEAFLAAFAPSLSIAGLSRTEVPAIGCPQDGQVGPQDAPALPKTVSVTVPAGMGRFLAFYSVSEGIESGILAPKGWDCFGTYGSDGNTLYVVPNRLGGDILDRSEKVKNGPAVTKRISIGGTSGRFNVAKIGGRIFPSARAFALRVRKEGLDDPKEYVFTRWPADRIVRLSEFAASYMTPPRANGLGTAFGLEPEREPVFGLVFLTDIEERNDGPLLEGISVRLDQDNRQLYPAIAIARLTSPETPPATNPPNQPNVGALGVVSDFYVALGRADGFTASEHVVPEKRERGPLSPDAITQFYSHLSEPLHLVSVTQLDDGSVLAQYRYRTSAGRNCNGKALVSLRLSAGKYLIDVIRALSKC
jgi:hypothetical protein